MSSLHLYISYHLFPFISKYCRKFSRETICWMRNLFYSKITTLLWIFFSRPPDVTVDFWILDEKSNEDDLNDIYYYGVTRTGVLGRFVVSNDTMRYRAEPGTVLTNQQTDWKQSQLTRVTMVTFPVGILVFLNVLTLNIIFKSFKTRWKKLIEETNISDRRK